MRVLLVSDIHSNLEALDAVLKDAKSRRGRFDLVLNLGDTVGYGADPNAVISRILNCGVEVNSILGNHDAAVLTGDVSGFNEFAARAVSWTRVRISDEGRRFLGRLPTTIKFRVGSVTAFAVHGSPWDNLNEYIFPSDALSVAHDLLEVTKANVVLMGHTHVPMIVELKERNGLIANPGSVGQSRDGIPLASYGVLESENNHARFEIFRVEYDLEETATKILSAGLPSFLAARLARGI